MMHRMILFSVCALGLVAVAAYQARLGGATQMAGHALPSDEIVAETLR